MKTKRALIGIIVIFFAFFFIPVGFNRATSNNDKLLIKTDDNSNVFTQLWFENIKLRNNYAKIKTKLDNIELKMKEIDDYDKFIYSQLMGVPSDSTIDVTKYRNSNVSYTQIDSLISNIDDKSRYISELLSIKLYNLEMKSLSKKNSIIMNSYPNISPIKTMDFICISDMFGWRMHPVYKTPLFHEGIDILADSGTKVYSTAQGKVVDIVYSNYGYGNKILIKHNSGYETLYAHLNVMYVKLGQHVKKNQLIGTVGNTGTSTGYHLHYEVHYKNETMNPLAYFYTYLGSSDIKNAIANK